MKIVSEEVQIGGRALKLEVGRFAQQATSNVLVSYGQTMVLTTVVASAKETELGYFPLSVEYIERLYAGGRIKGSRWVKREGRPSDEAVLAGRLIDRSIRPLFPKTYKNEVQIAITVLSVDGENDPDVLGMIGASAALAISPIPWAGPIGAVRLGLGQESGESHFLVNPTDAELATSAMNLVVSCTADKVLMIEAEAKQLPEAVMVEAIKTAKNESSAIIEAIEKLVKKVGQPKVVVADHAHEEKLLQLLKKDFSKEIEAAAEARVTKEYGAGTDELIDAIFTAGKEEFDKKQIAAGIDYQMQQLLRQDVLKNGKRADGRKLDELRPISCEVGLLPRTHGSAVFARGQTQALTVATLGTPALEQLIETAMGEESKRFIHHYNFPPYSVGETGRFGTPKRREIGHGALAERALAPVIPSVDEFPYTIRVVSEIMSSNGSTSMASTCGSTLALMDAGVPIKAPVAGISIGLITDGKKYELLTDIIGLEDFGGDMDFKVAGTRDGITAIQLDVKVDGLTDEIVAGAIERAKKARMIILDKMAAVLPAARPQLSQYAPKIKTIKIAVEKIGDVIGSGGKTIRKIIAQTGATVDVDDEGVVTVASTDIDAVEKALKWVEGLTRDIVVGEEFAEGEVKRILPFGAFVEILPGKEGMVHVSQMSTNFVNNPEEVVKIGQKVSVRVIEVDDQGRINLSMLKEGESRPPRESSPRGEPGRFDHRSSGRSFDRGDHGNRRFGGDRPRRPRY